MTLVVLTLKLKLYAACCRRRKHCSVLNATICVCLFANCHLQFFHYVFIVLLLLLLLLSPYACHIAPFAPNAVSHCAILRYLSALFATVYIYSSIHTRIKHLLPYIKHSRIIYFHIICMYMCM